MADTGNRVRGLLPRGLRGGRVVHELGEESWLRAFRDLPNHRWNRSLGLDDEVGGSPLFLEIPYFQRLAYFDT